MSYILLAGNHRAKVEEKGHNGEPLELLFQEHAFAQACRVYRALANEEINAVLFTLIDHKGGVRGLTGRRNNGKILKLSQLHPQFQDPFKTILKAHKIQENELNVIPEKTLKDHQMGLLQNSAFDSTGAHQAFNNDGAPVCRGLAGAYMDFAVRKELELGNSPFALDWFVELKPPVPSAYTFIQGTHIYRMGMVPGKSVLDVLKVQGWACTEGSPRLLQSLRASDASSLPLSSQ